MEHFPPAPLALIARLAPPTKLSTRRIADLLGVSQMEVLRDCQVANAGHLADSAIVTEAHALIHMSPADESRPGR